MQHFQLFGLLRRLYRIHAMNHGSVSFHIGFGAVFLALVVVAGFILTYSRNRIPNLATNGNYQVSIGEFSGEKLGSNSDLIIDNYISKTHIFQFVKGGVINVFNRLRNNNFSGVATITTGNLEGVEITSIGQQFYISGRAGNGGRDNWWRVEHRLFRCALDTGCALMRSGNFAIYSIGAAQGQLFVSEYDWNDHATADGLPPPYKTTIHVYRDNILISSQVYDFGISHFAEYNDKIIGYSPGGNYDTNKNLVYFYIFDAFGAKPFIISYNLINIDLFDNYAVFADNIIITFSKSFSLDIGHAFYSYNIYNNGTRIELNNNFFTLSNILYEDGKIVFIDNAGALRSLLLSIFIENVTSIS